LVRQINASAPRRLKDGFIRACGNFNPDGLDDDSPRCQFQSP
jgi:hypothetical protein